MEHTAHAADFSAEVCKAWEREFFSADVAVVKKVALRIGFALGRSEGAYPKDF